MLNKDIANAWRKAIKELKDEFEQRKLKARRDIEILNEQKKLAGEINVWDANDDE